MAKRGSNPQAGAAQPLALVHRTPGKVGHPPHKPTEKTRAEVLALSSYGTNQHDIANYLGIDTKTLTKWYRAELDVATTKANAAVARSLYRQAVENGNVTAMIFWLKTRGKWREIHDLNVTSEDGSMTPPRVIEVHGGGQGKG